VIPRGDSRRVDSQGGDSNCGDIIHADKQRKSTLLQFGRAHHSQRGDNQRGDGQRHIVAYLFGVYKDVIHLFLFKFLSFIGKGFIIYNSK
jgi:hypothetical protein